MTDAPTSVTIRDYIVGSLLKGREVTDDDNLLLSGMLDSLAVMSLVAFIEKSFSLSIPFDDVIIENFMSVDAMTAYVQGRLAADA